MTPSRLERWHGVDEPPPEMRGLQAGSLSAVLEGIDLRYVRVGGREIIRRLFVAVRDDSWGTIQPSVENLHVEEGDGRFRVTFDAFHESGPISFRWKGELTGADGILDCLMDGVAGTDFPYNRIGFCVLHPMEHAGSSYRARTPDAEIEGALPTEIGAQRVEDGKLWPLFPSYERLELDLGDGVTANFEFEGDLFEMEDQRNWTDASFKTYSTPLALGWPHRAEAGQRITQHVRLSVAGAARARADDGPARIELGEVVGTLPAIGLGLSPEATLGSRDLLAALRPAHLRTELRVGEPGWQEGLARAVSASRALGAPLELALFADESPEAELDVLAKELAGADVVRVLVLREGPVVTEPKLVALVRQRLSGALRNAQLGGGTDSWFVDLNRAPPEIDGFDLVGYSICATVHADDDTSVSETASAQGETVRSARALTGLPVIVGPVTIRPRSWPHGTLDESLLPFQVDRRQLSLFGAAWTLASAKHLAQAGAAAVTYFETEGWRGVVESEGGSPKPAVFCSQPGQVFPLYHVLRDLGEARGAEVVEARSSRPLDVVALTLRVSGALHILIANLTPQEQEVDVAALGERLRLRRLYEGSYELATLRPEAFRGSFEDAGGGQLLRLRQYEVIRIDA